MNDVAAIAWPYHRVPVPMFQTDAAQRVRHVNRHWLALLGYDAADVLDQPLARFMAEASRAGHQDHLDGVPEDVADVECRFVAASGAEVEVLLSHSVERDGTGAKAGILGAMMDLTALRGAERAAGLNAALLNTVITHARDAILITEAEPVDAPGPRIRYANRRSPR